MIKQLTKVYYIYHKDGGFLHNRAFTKMSTMLAELQKLGPEYDYDWNYIPFVGRSVCYVEFQTQRYVNEHYPVATKLPSDLSRYVYACSKHAKESDEWQHIKSVLQHCNYPFEGKSDTNFIEDETSIRNLRSFEARYYNSQFYLYYGAKIRRIRLIKN